MVESYVLGLASEQERAEFEQLCTQYPELIEARINFELLLEKQALENAEAPPVDTKDKIWSALQQAPSSNTSKIISMEPASPRKTSGTTWLAAASVILMLVAAYFAYDFRKKNDELKSLNEEMKASNQQMQEKINRMDSIEQIMHDPNVTVVNMKAMIPAAPSASVYWDTTSSNVYLVVKNMPKLASNKQYQLWSIIDSAGKMKPSSLGLFDGGDEKLFFKMQNAQNADHFAITIEDRGNSEGPNLQQLQAMGETKSKL
jgi:anti-sigma-K factor RskA